MCKKSVVVTRPDINQPITKRSPTLDRDAEYTKTSKVSRLPGYLTIQMMRFQVWLYSGLVGDYSKMLPSKSLNVYDIGMKMYTSQPISAFLQRKAEL